MKTEKPSWWRREGWFALAAAGLVGVTVAAEAYTPYLPAVGPAPLRFRPDYKPAVHIKPAPLSTADQPAAPVPPPVVTPPPTAPVRQTNEIVAQSPPPTTTPEQPKPDSSVVSPQMLLRYFNRPTNAPDANAALGFTPPPQPDQPTTGRAALSAPPH